MTTTRQRPQGTTADRILDTAERLVQLRGFNGFSYADVAAELQITKASLHYHFPSKAELGEALIARYGARFAAALADIDAGPANPTRKLAAYSDLYAGVLEGQRMCLCGMLAAEYRTLPDPMRSAVVAFFNENEQWLTRLLQQGKRAGELHFDGSARETARALLSGLEGALLTSRPYHDPARFQRTARRLIITLAIPNTPRRQPQPRAHRQ
jgi:TetR/AcrR family transcriptional regulator, transcriptional repressor for nem operon